MGVCQSFIHQCVIKCHICLICHKVMVLEPRWVKHSQHVRKVKKLEFIDYVVCLTMTILEVLLDKKILKQQLMPGYTWPGLYYSYLRDLGDVVHTNMALFFELSILFARYLEYLLVNVFVVLAQSDRRQP